MLFNKSAGFDYSGSDYSLDDFVAALGCKIRRKIFVVEGMGFSCYSFIIFLHSKVLPLASLIKYTPGAKLATCTLVLLTKSPL